MNMLQIQNSPTFKLYMWYIMVFSEINIMFDFFFLNEDLTLLTLYNFYLHGPGLPRVSIYFLNK